MATARVRTEPRISLNKLAEYMVAPPRRRWRIICDQKRPPAFQAARYSEAQEAICHYLKSGARNSFILLEAIGRLRSYEPTTDWDQQRVQLCVEALERFLEFPRFEFLKNMEVLYGTPTPWPLAFGGLSVSVRPDMMLSEAGLREDGRCGAIKLYLGKTVPLGIASGKYAATLLHQYMEANPINRQQASPQHCVVIDVFANKIYAAPRSHRRLRNDLIAACEEIGRLWAAA